MKNLMKKYIPLMLALSCGTALTSQPVTDNKVSQPPVIAPILAEQVPQGPNTITAPEKQTNKVEGEIKIVDKTQPLNLNGGSNPFTQNNNLNNPLNNNTNINGLGAGTTDTNTNTNIVQGTNTNPAPITLPEIKTENLQQNKDTTNQSTTVNTNPNGSGVKTSGTSSNNTNNNNTNPNGLGAGTPGTSSDTAPITQPGITTENKPGTENLQQNNTLPTPLVNLDPITVKGFNENSDEKTQPTIYTANAKMLDLWRKAQAEVANIKNIPDEKEIDKSVRLLKATIDKFVELLEGSENFEIATKSDKQYLFTNNLKYLLRNSADTSITNKIDEVRDYYTNIFSRQKEFLKKSEPLLLESLSNFENYLDGRELKIGEGPEDMVQLKKIHFTTETSNEIHFKKHSSRSFSQLLWANKGKIIATGACLTIGALYFFGLKPHDMFVNGYFSLLALLPGFKASANTALQIGMNKTLTAWEKTKPGLDAAAQWSKNLFIKGPQPLNTTINLVP